MHNFTPSLPTYLKQQPTQQGGVEDAQDSNKHTPGRSMQHTAAPSDNFLQSRSLYTQTVGALLH